jgi:mono/diheme cytochrome c family protein
VDEPVARHGYTAVTPVVRVIAVVAVGGAALWFAIILIDPSWYSRWAARRSGERGAIEFSDACAPCHDRSGRGVTGKGRPLVDSPWVAGPSSRFIRIILDGVTHDPSMGPAPQVPMPSWRIVNDEYIASVATYARKHFGGGALAVGASEVREIRQATAGRARAWTRDELSRIP